VYLVNEKVKAGATLEEAAAYCEEIKLKIHHIVTVEDLIYLRRSGRVSATSAFFGTMLQIKPIIHLDNEGHLIAIEKKQGRRRALTTLVEYMERDGGALSGHPIFLSHGDCEEDALLVKAQIKQKLGADVMMIEMISPNIGAHSGPGTVALFYVSDAPR
jgi:DegV family protein with EDD domain